MSNKIHRGFGGKVACTSRMIKGAVCVPGGSLGTWLVTTSIVGSVDEFNRRRCKKCFGEVR